MDPAEVFSLGMDESHWTPSGGILPGCYLPILTNATGAFATRECRGTGPRRHENPSGGILPGGCLTSCIGTPAEAFSLGGCLTIHMGTPAEAFSLELINYPQKNRIGTPAEVFSLGVV